MALLGLEDQHSIQLSYRRKMSVYFTGKHKENQPFLGTKTTPTA